MDRWLKYGLSATISTGNFLTGSKIVEIHHPIKVKDNDVAYKAQQYLGYRIIPLAADNISQLLTKTSEFVEHLAKLPLDKLSTDASGLLIELSNTAKEFQKVSKNLEQLLADTNQQSTINNLNNTLKSFTKVANDFAKGSKNYHELTQTLLLMQENLQALKPLLKKVDNKPNSLIFSGAIDDDIIPKKWIKHNKKELINE
jgi:paraquat-inducible protein B